MCDEGPAGIDEIFILVFYDPMMPSMSLWMHSHRKLLKTIIASCRI